MARTPATIITAAVEISGVVASSTSVNAGVVVEAAVDTRTTESMVTIGSPTIDVRAADITTTIITSIMVAGKPIGRLQARATSLAKTPPTRSLSNGPTVACSAGEVRTPSNLCRTASTEVMETVTTDVVTTETTTATQRAGPPTRATILSSLQEVANRCRTPTTMGALLQTTMPEATKDRDSTSSTHREVPILKDVDTAAEAETERRCWSDEVSRKETNS